MHGTAARGRGVVARRRRVVWLAAGLIVVALAAIPLATDRRDVLNLLFLVYLSVCLGQSWNILAGFAGQVNLGHAAFFGVGALVTRTLWAGSGLPLPAAFAAGGLAAVLFALLIGVPTFRLRGVYFSIGTLGVAEVLRLTTANALPLVSALPADLIATYTLAPRYYLALGLAGAAMLAAHALLRSRLGLGVLAIREDEEAAEATGVAALPHKLAALGLSALLAGLAGATFAFYHVSYYPELAFSPNWTFDAVLIAFVGGVGTLVGPLVGAVFYVLVRELLAVSLVQVHQVIFGALFIAVVLILPGGLVDAASRLRRPRPGRDRPAPPGHP
ncbi:MAG TPA: branched-chain amino acid ABC transporter permease [Chloroflexota bacterium]|nr:branched-chain amino acid ABC transporter permease [Chloroflexota bacterium]